MCRGRVVCTRVTGEEEEGGEKEDRALLSAVLCQHSPKFTVCEYA